ncbi:hypothetical protein AgCh_020727 [Apium graveolens]
MLGIGLSDGDAAGKLGALMVVAIGFFLYLAPDKDNVKMKAGYPPSIELKIGFTHCVGCGEAFGHFVQFYGTRVETKVCRGDAIMQMKPAFY